MTTTTRATHRFVDEAPIDGLCDTCGSSAQFHETQPERVATTKCPECGGPAGEGYEQHKASCTFVKLNYNPQPERALGEQVTHDFTNWRVDYCAPTKPEHSFEPYCAILADSAQYGKCRVFDVPDPDESQRAAAEDACKALNNHTRLVAALEQVQDYCRSALKRRTAESYEFAVRMAEEYASDALSRVQG